MPTEGMIVDDIPYKIASITLTNVETLLFLSFVIPLIVFTIVSNSLVVHVIRKFPPLKNPSNHLLMSLAFTDLLSALLVMPVSCYYSVTGIWNFGILGCKAWLFSSCFLCGSSILHLCAIAIDRYKAITEPLKYGSARNNQKSLMIICLVWICSFIMVCPQFVLPWGTKWPEEFLDNTPCTVPQDPPYAIYGALTMFFIPVLILLVTYLRLCQVNRARYKKKISRASQQLALKQVSLHKAHLQVPQRKGAPNYWQGSNSTSRSKFLSQKKSRVTLELIYSKDEIKVRFSQNHQKCHNEASSDNMVTDQDNGTEEITVAVDEVNDRGVTKCVVRGSKRRLILPNLKVDLNRKRYGPNLRSKCRQCQGSITRSNARGICQVCSVPNNLLLAAEEARLAILIHQEKRSMLTIFVIVCIFVVCWAPAYVIYVMMTLFPDTKMPPFVMTSAVWLCYLNSACNPIVYTIFNKDFRKAFIRIFCR